MKKLYVLVVLLCSLTLTIIAQPVVSNGPVTNVISNLFQAKWKGFKNNGSNASLYLGTNVNTSSKREEVSHNNLYIKPGNNSISLVYSPSENRLRATINNKTIAYNNVSNNLVGPGNLCRINYLQFMHDNNEDGRILVNNVVINGNSIAGNFSNTGNNTAYFNISNVNFSAGFTLTATLVLSNASYGQSEASQFTIQAGERSAVVSTEIAAACINSGANVTLRGLLPSTAYTLSYNINTDAGNNSASFTTNAAGIGQFASRNITKEDQGKTLKILSLNAGCDWVPGIAAANTITVNNLWTGIASQDWNNPANWSNNTLPTTNCDWVIIPSTAALQPILGTSVYKVNNLKVAAGTTLKIENAVIKINGLMNIEGTLDVTKGSLEMVGKTGVQSVDISNFVSKSIRTLINSNSTGIQITGANADTLKITQSILFGNVNNSQILTNGKLTLVSNATSTAAVGDLTNDGINSGNSIIGKVNVERFISNGAKWRLLAVPTNSTQTFKQSWQENAPSASGNPANGYGVLIGDNRGNWAAGGFDMYTPGGPTVKTYNAANNSWVGITNTQAAIKNTSGYMTYIRSNRSGVLSATTIRTSGELYTGIQPVINVPANQFMVVGNPYAAEVDFTKINKTGLQDVFYVWDPKAGGGYGLGAYQTMTKQGSNYVVLPGGGSYGAPNSVVNTIESGQAFFVKARATGGTIQFEENDKQTGSRLVFRAPAENSPILLAVLYAVTTDTTTLLDAAMANFDTTYTNGVNEDDILKITNGSENVSIKNGTSLLLADRRSDPTAQDTIRLNLTGVRIQTYKWSITMDHMIANGRTAFLKDAYTNSLTPLNMDGTTDYSFTMVNIAGAYASGRFSIVFAEAVVLPVTITAVSANRSNTKSSNVTVNWKVENEIGLQSYEVEHSSNGSTFKTFSNVNATAGNSGSTAYTQTHTQAIDADNFYRIKAISLSGLVQYSAIVKVAAIKKGRVPAISVYPNPVVNKNMNLQFLNQPAGTYQVKLLNQSGSVVYQNRVDINNSNAVKMMQLNNSTAAGIYQLVITDNNAGKSVMQVVVL